MTLIHLVRHASHRERDDVLVGHMPAVTLSDTGRAEASRLAERLHRDGLGGVYTSPRTRAVETAHIIAARAGLPFNVVDELDEIAFGQWSGRSYRNLASDPRWIDWNLHRASASTPAGATMANVQARVMRFIEKLSAETSRASIALITHGDVIRAAVLHIKGQSLDCYASFDIAPATITTIALDAHGRRILSLNEAA